MSSGKEPAPGSTGSAPSIRRDAERNRQQILTTAREIFARQGLNVGLNEIARHAGVGVATVYRRFPDKEALIAAVLRDDIAALAVRTEDALRADSAWEGLTQLLHAVARSQIENRGLWETITGAGHGQELTARLRTTIGVHVRELIERAQQEGTLRAGVSIGDLLMILLMVGEVASSSEAVCPGAYHRYFDLLLESLRADASKPALPPGMSESDASLIMQSRAQGRSRPASS
ncbi:TetR/AcrR family transcriptional regulator [Paractinoplanes atraurantiacus]|uniref:DNA-binding transcriptional regulator, AcrR family n=1 Tax=Paractinoplanes atraurantiacus TaxID=1036182 RepID=A0A285H6G8_9ACTN|nr:TetR/AcrR family transcriptional regulator [Actinoplanes atraurantiacus]SNY31380.1 DNA-binding transcriptional regulator, AcrR family [Actinoplanes atraurantiacus]